MSQPFRLSNDPPRPKRVRFDSQPARQLVMLTGLSLLPDQQDLFSTDGGTRDGRKEQSVCDCAGELCKTTCGVRQEKRCDPISTTAERSVSTAGLKVGRNGSHSSRLRDHANLNWCRNCGCKYELADGSHRFFCLACEATELAEVEELNGKAG